MRGRFAALAALLVLLPACGGRAPAIDPGGVPGALAHEGQTDTGEGQVGSAGAGGDPSGGGTAAQPAQGRVPGTGDVVARYGGPTEVVPPAPHEPAEVVIPSIGVRSSLLRLGLYPDGSLETPGDYGLAGWYTEAPPPGEVGPAIIAGHVDSRRGPAVFYRLHELEPGDLVEVVRGDGELVVFRVDRVEQHDKEAFPTQEVYGNTEGPQLRLITCGGDFDRRQRHYRDNIIVYASLHTEDEAAPPGGSDEHEEEQAPAGDDLGEPAEPGEPGDEGEDLGEDEGGAGPPDTGSASVDDGAPVDEGPGEPGEPGDEELDDPLDEPRD